MDSSLLQTLFFFLSFFFSKFSILKFKRIFLVFVNTGPYGGKKLSTPPAVVMRSERNVMINKVAMAEYKVIILGAICQKIIIKNMAC